MAQDRESKVVKMSKGKVKKGKENILYEKINLTSLERGMEQQVKQQW